MYKSRSTLGGLVSRLNYATKPVHDSTRDGRVRDRIKAFLLASEGWIQSMISQALRIHESTVARHLSDYVLSEKLKSENGILLRNLSPASEVVPKLIFL